jgi:hypothetical protein
VYKISTVIIFNAFIKILAKKWNQNFKNIFTNLNKEKLLKLVKIRSTNRITWQRKRQQ